MLVAVAMASVALTVSAAGCGADGGDSASVPTPTAGATVTEPGPTTAATTTPPVGVIDLRIRGGKVAGDIRPPAVPVGATVTLTVDSDVADTVHVHGYDHEFAVGPGTAGTRAFVADIPGRFEVETHDGGRVLFTLTVR